MKVCFLMSAERKVRTEARLETSPNSPRLEKSTPSHQNSNIQEKGYELIVIVFACSYLLVKLVK